MPAGLSVPPLGLTITERMTSSHNVRFTAPPFLGLTLLILFRGAQRLRRRSDGSGRAPQDVVLPWASTRERDDRRHACAARDHSAWLEPHGSLRIRCDDR